MYLSPVSAAGPFSGEGSLADTVIFLAILMLSIRSLAVAPCCLMSVSIGSLAFTAHLPPCCLGRARVHIRVISPDLSAGLLDDAGRPLGGYPSALVLF